VRHAAWQRTVYLRLWFITASSIASRVVPAMSETIARSLCVSLLSRDDFPTLGLASDASKVAVWRYGKVAVRQSWATGKRAGWECELEGSWKVG
jgi:hypothetical protein